MDREPEDPDHLDLRKSGMDCWSREFLSSGFRGCRRGEEALSMLTRVHGGA
jgi:hypothetical protein